MAVPTGDYELTATVDLSPYFGLVTHSGEIHIDLPPADLLEQRLQELDSESEETRRLALLELRHFKHAAERVLPAVLDRLEDGSPAVRSTALSVLAYYRVQAIEHVEVFLRFLEEGETDPERVNAAYALASLAPVSPEIEKVLVDAFEGAAESQKMRFESALRNYRRRAKAEEGAR